MHSRANPMLHRPPSLALRLLPPPACSALRDRRFTPIERGELPALTVTVSLLRGFERIAEPADWELGVHGLLLEFADPLTRQRRTATFLPEVGARLCTALWRRLQFHGTEGRGLV
jgi:hypothetical protein